jgi:hypothetical protein
MVVCINPYIHRCVVRQGSAAGNKTAIEVTPYNKDFECEHCGEPLATLEQIVDHMYEELTLMSR